VPASAIDTSKMADGMAEALNKDLAADGLTAEVTATASDMATARRRLQQEVSCAALARLALASVAPLGAAAPWRLAGS
jgi:hypothetical protein